MPRFRQAMRPIAILLGLMTGLACAAVGLLGDWDSGPAPEAIGAGILFFVAAGVAWRWSKYRFLTAAWGFFLCLWLLLLELYFGDFGTAHKVQTLRSDSLMELIGISAITALAVLGLSTSLLAPQRRQESK